MNPFEFESSTLTMVLQQIIALKTIESKFYVATPHAGLIPAPSMASSYSDESTVSIIRYAPALKWYENNIYKFFAEPRTLNWA